MYNAELNIFLGNCRHRRAEEWGGDVVRVSYQPGAGILQYLCDSCKTLVAIIERQLGAVKAHDVCTSAANIVRALQDGTCVS